MARALATDQLSSEARSLMLACFRERMTAAATVARIKEQTGETVAERTLARRKSEWEAEADRRLRGREQMEDLLAAARSGDHTASEMVNALAIEQLMRDPDGTLSLDPIALQKTSIAAERVRLQRDNLELKRRQIALDEAKFAQLKREKELAIAATDELEKAAKGGKQLTADDLRKIRDIYGLRGDDGSEN
jgi:hypothetical protein